MQHWYVYYKATPAECGTLRARVRDLQDHIARTTHVRVRLLQRTERSAQDERDDLTTMMEVYEDIDDADAFARTLDAAVRTHLPAAHLAARRIERFEDA